MSHWNRIDLNLNSDCMKRRVVILMQQLEGSKSHPQAACLMAVDDHGALKLKMGWFLISLERLALGSLYKRI